MTLSETFSISPRSCAEGVPKEGETLTTRITSRSRADYKIDATTGCWVWQKAVDHAGYGSYRGKAHRAYFQRAHPDIDITGLDIHHLCRNPRCVNPDHLEAVHRKKHLSQHKRSESPLTEAEVAEIRASTARAHELAAQYGVTQDVVTNIWLVRDWLGVGPMEKPVRYCEHCGDEIAQTRRRHARFCDADCRVRARRAKKWTPNPARWTIPGKLPKAEA